MMKLREKQKLEAIKRMKMLKVIREAIEQFEDDDKVMLSENGFLFWLNEDEKKMVREFEEEYNSLVYMVIHNRTEFGELYSMLYVSKNEKEWKQDIDDLKESIALAYVKNIDDDYCSEFGSIGIRNKFGGIIRVS